MTQAFGLLMQPLWSSHIWQGASGKTWLMQVKPLEASNGDVPSVYIMAKRNRLDGTVTPIYIGETDNTGRRFSEHARDKLQAAVRLGADELHLLSSVHAREDRLAIETDLRKAYPFAPLNRQGDKPLGLLGLL